MQRFAQLKSLDEAADSEVQNEMKLDELRRAKRVGHLEIAQKELELTKKQGLVSLRYYKSKVGQDFLPLFEKLR